MTQTEGSGICGTDMAAGMFLKFAVRLCLGNDTLAHRDLDLGPSVKFAEAFGCEAGFTSGHM